VTYEGGIVVSYLSDSRGRLRQLAGVVRVAWIPVACAVVVAIAGKHPNGKALALALLIPALFLGVVVRAREIFSWRRGGRAGGRAAA
jgi:predicted branched-subunit amino acid permease